MRGGEIKKELLERGGVWRRGVEEGCREGWREIEISSEKYEIPS